MRDDVQACREFLRQADSVKSTSGESFPFRFVQASIQQAMVASETRNAVPEHCDLVGAINERKGTVDPNQTYAIKFHMRLPVRRAWNGRFLMTGGGGTNGNLGDAFGTLPGATQADNALSRGFAVITTDSGHDNVTNNDPMHGGIAVFARDPQARRDLYFNAYDLVTQIGEDSVARFYATSALKSYFMGCSEGGREAMMMTQRFPKYYDGVVAGAPLLRGGTQTNSAQSDQRLAELARSMDLMDANGLPALNKTFSDSDVQLIAKAVIDACDASDGLVDGMVLNPTACTAAIVHPRIDALACVGSKTEQCLSPGQMSAFKDVMAGAHNMEGQVLYNTWHYDPGLGGVANGVLNPNWRNWFFGTYGSNVNNAIKLALSTNVVAMLSITPPSDYTVSEAPGFLLKYDYRALSTSPAKNYPAFGIYTESPGAVYRADSTDLSTFRDRGGKLIVYHGMADPAIAFDDTVRYFTSMSQVSDGARFARLFPVPGMNHCSGGPALDKFDALTAIVNWVEGGVAPESIRAEASVPAYWGVQARSRPLCAYPKTATYRGEGDVNNAASFLCR